MEFEEFKLAIDIGNDAMEDHDDVAAALRRVAEMLDGRYDAGTISDHNGNRVGEWGFSPEPGRE